MCYSRVFLAASAVFAVCAHAQDATPTPSAGDVLLHPSHITLTGHFDAPLGPTAVERVIQSVGEQIDVKRARLTPHAHRSHRCGICESGAICQQTQLTHSTRLLRRMMTYSSRQIISRFLLDSSTTS